MTEYVAKLSYLRISPRKVRLVADLIRGESVYVARHQLQYSSKRSSNNLLKLLNSVVANAKDIDEDIDEASLYIKEIYVDEGPKLKRYMPVARGTVHEIHKKSSHIKIVITSAENKKINKKQAKNSKQSKEGKRLTQTVGGKSAPDPIVATAKKK